MWRNGGAEGSSRNGSAAHGTTMLDFGSGWEEEEGGGEGGQRRRLTALLSLGQVRKPTLTTWYKPPEHSMLQIPLGLSRAKVA